MFSDIQTFLAAAQPLLRAFDDWARDHMDYVHAVADHLCYKCATPAEFEQIRSLFEEHPGTFIYQSVISKRRIAVIKLPQPLPSLLGPIGFLELSDQKPDNSQVSGFDHVEIHPVPASLDYLAGALADRGVALKRQARPHHTTYDGVLAGADREYKLRLEDEPLIEKIKREMR